MSEYYGGDYLYSVLNADAGVIALLDQYTDQMGNLAYPIFNARIVPTECNARKTINFYRLDPFDATLEYFTSKWSIDCRADSEYDSQSIACAVTSALNRKHVDYDGKTYFGTISILATIPPLNDADQYNTSIQIQIRRA